MQIDIFNRMEMWQGVSPEGHYGQHIDVTEWDWWGQWTGRHERKPWPPRDEDADGGWTIHNVDLMFNRYDTDQIIAPTWSKARDQVIMHEFGEEWEEELDLGYELTPEAAEVATHGAPQTMDALLDMQMGAFNVLALLGHAKRVERKIKDKNHFVKALQERGYTVGFDDGVLMASKP